MARTFRTSGTLALGALVLSLAIASIQVPTASGCDPIGGTCVFEVPEDDTQDCESHLVVAHVEAWIDCRVSLAAAPSRLIEQDAPMIDATASVEITVIIQRTGTSNGDETWGFAREKNVPGVRFDGPDLFTGTLRSGQSSASFTFNISADDSSATYAVVPIAFWGAEHDEQFDWIGVAIDRSTFWDRDVTFWMAFWALIIALVALGIALYVALK